MDDYSAAHRKHMNYEIEHQDKEWKRLNVQDRQFDWLKLVVYTVLIFMGSIVSIFMLDKFLGLFR